MKKLYFKVKIGFGQNDFVNITEVDYPKVLKAQVMGKVALLSTGESLSGQIILSIIPNYSKSLGYKSDYEVPIIDVPKDLIKQYESFGEQINSRLESNDIKLLN